MARNYNDEVSRIIRAPWNDRESKSMPTSESVRLAGGAVNLEATFLYADLANSSQLVDRLDKRVAAKLLKAFVQTCVQLIHEHKGKVISFDGDRVLGIFTEDRKNSRASITALKIKYVVQEIIQPQFVQQYPQTVGKEKPIRHCVGIDTGNVWIVRAGARGANDLLTVGNAANLAAKLSDIRNGEWNTYITAKVYKVLAEDAKFSNGRNMWNAVTREVSGKTETLYKSTFRWAVN